MSAQGYEIATELGQLSAAISGGATSLVLRSGQGSTALLAPVIAFGNGVNTPDAATDLDVSLIYCSMEI